MDSTQIASALGVSGTVLAIVTAVGVLVARGLRSRCVIAGIAVDVHPASAAEMASEAPAQEAQASHVTLNVNTPAATHDEARDAPAPIHVPRNSVAKRESKA
jgi:hypothetical protein